MVLYYISASTPLLQNEKETHQYNHSNNKMIITIKEIKVKTFYLIIWLSYQFQPTFLYYP